MVHRSGDTLIVRSVVSGDQLYLDLESRAKDYSNSSKQLSSNDRLNSAAVDKDETEPVNYSDANVALPQCKIKRNYSCNSCTYFTQNPRHFLTHLKVEHGEKIIINACKHCLYASRHYQKLVRHMKMVHGSTDGLEEQALSRKRASQLARELKKRKNTIEDLQHQQTQQSGLDTVLASLGSTIGTTHHNTALQVSTDSCSTIVLICFLNCCLILLPNIVTGPSS